MIIMRTGLQRYFGSRNVVQPNTVFCNYQKSLTSLMTHFVITNQRLTLHFVVDVIIKNDELIKKIIQWGNQ